MRHSLLLLVALCWPVRGQDYKELIAAGEQALARGDYQGALRAYQAAHKIAVDTILEPTPTQQIFVGFAEASAMVGDYREAEPVAQEASQMPLAPELKAKANRVLVRARAFRGDFNAARPELQAAFADLDKQLRARKVDPAPLLREIGMLPRALPPEGARLLPVRASLYLGDYGAAETQLGSVEPRLRGDPLEHLEWGLLKARTLAGSDRIGAALKQFQDTCGGFAKLLGAQRPDAASCFAEAGAVAFQARKQDLAKDWLERGVTALDRYPEGHPMSALRELAAGYNSALKGQADDARSHWNRARAARVDLYGDWSAPVLEVDLSVAGLELSQGRFQDAQGRLDGVRGAMALAQPQHYLRRRALLGLAKCAAAKPDWAQAAVYAADWIKNRPGNADEDLDQAFSLRVQAEAAMVRGKPEEAEPKLAKSIEIRRSFNDLNASESLGLSKRLAEIRVKLGNASAGAATMDEAMRDPAATKDLGPAARAVIFESIAEWRESANQIAEAIDELRKARAEREQLPPDRAYLALLLKIARLSKTAGRPQDAVGELQRALELMPGSGSEEALNIAADLAEIHSAGGNSKAALPLWQMLEEAGRVRKLGIGARNRQLVLERLGDAQQAQHDEGAAKTWIQLARLNMVQANLDDAEKFAKRAQAIASSGGLETATAFLLRASIQNQRSNGKDAEEYLKQALPLTESDPAARAICLAELARVYIVRTDKESADSANQYCTEAESVSSNLQVPSVKATVSATRALLLSRQSGNAVQSQAAKLYDEFRETEKTMDYEKDFPLFSPLAEASRFYARRENGMDLVVEIDTRRLEATEAAFGEHSPETARAELSLAGTLINLKKFADGEALYDKALTIFEALPNEKASAAGVRVLMGDSYARQGKYAEASRMYKDAVDEDPAQEWDLMGRIAENQARAGDPLAASEIYAKLRDHWADNYSNWVDASRKWCVALIDARNVKLGSDECKKLRQKVHKDSHGDSPTELGILRDYAAAMRRANSREADGLEKEANTMAAAIGQGRAAPRK